MNHSFHSDALRNLYSGIMHTVNIIEMYIKPDPFGIYPFMAQAASKSVLPGSLF